MSLSAELATQMMAVMAAADTRLQTAMRAHAAATESASRELQKTFEAVAEENGKLKVTLASEKGRYRELKAVYRERMRALEQTSMMVGVKVDVRESVKKQGERILHWMRRKRELKGSVRGAVGSHETTVQVREEGSLVAAAREICEKWQREILALRQENNLLKKQVGLGQELYALRFAFQEEMKQMTAERRRV